MAKDKMAEAQEAIRERNALILQKAALAREVDELKEKMASSEQAFVEEEQKKVKDIAAARAEAVESYRTSDATAYATAVASPVKETVITTSEPATANTPPAKA
ncbi:unnamed protein product [Prunus armeniaca]